MRAYRHLVAGFCLLLATACDETSPVAPTVPLNQEFTLAPGQTSALETTSVRVQFMRVTGDSRCPADAICVWGGDALVEIRVFDSGSADYELHTGDHSRAAITHAGIRLELMQLQPYPFSSRTIQPDEYRATFKASR
jgi:hypothetical protein